jgi:hypothetical protein
VTEYQRQRVLELFEQEDSERQSWLLASGQRLREWLEWAMRVLGIIIDIARGVMWLKSQLGY